MEQELTNLFWKGPENVLGLPATACQLQLLNSVARDQPQTMSINRWACLLVKLPLWKQALGKSCQWIVACWLVSWGWWQQVTVVECLPSARTSCPFSSWIFTKHCEVHVSVITTICTSEKTRLSGGKFCPRSHGQQGIKSRFQARWFESRNYVLLFLI